MRLVYRYDSALGQVVGICDDEKRAGKSGPFLWRDGAAYRSPVTGRWIEGRRARRDDLRRHGCVDAREFGRRRPGRD